MRILLTVLLVLWCAKAVANEPPPVPEGGFIHLFTSPCTDAETGEKGTCYLMQDVEGNLFATFWQGDTLMVIRRIVGDGYENIWVNDLYMGV